MNKEEIKFNTNEDIIYQIEMMSYAEYNYRIATANEHIGDIYSYRDIEDMKHSETLYEKALSYIAIKQLQQENKQLKEENKDLKRTCELFSNSLWSGDLKKAEEKVEYLKEQKENKDKWFQLIADIGYDYDGFNEVENLKGLIDELVQYALNGRDNDDFDTLMFEGDSNE